MLSICWEASSTGTADSNSSGVLMGDWKLPGHTENICMEFQLSLYSSFSFFPFVSFVSFVSFMAFMLLILLILLISPCFILVYELSRAFEREYMGVSPKAYWKAGSYVLIISETYSRQSFHSHIRIGVKT